MPSRPRLGATRLVRMARAIPREVGHGRRALADWRRYGADVLAYRLLGVWSSMPSRDRERQVTTRDGILLTYRRNRGDIQSIREVFCDEHYRIPSSIRPRTLVDLGANIGLTSVWFARRYGVERVVAVEPVGANAAIARRNLAANGVEGEVVEAAVGPSRGRVAFELAAASNLGRVVGPSCAGPSAAGGAPGGGSPAVQAAGTGSSAPGSGGRPGEGLIEVEMVTMYDVLARLGTGADLVKLDIEGGEDALLQGDVSWLDQVGAIIAELHPQVVDLDSIAGRLEARGLRHLPPSSLWPGSMAMFVRPSHVRPVPEEPALRRLLEEAGPPAAGIAHPPVSGEGTGRLPLAEEQPPVPDPEIERLLFPGGRP